MANFVALIERDSGVREKFKRDALAMIPHFPGMQARNLECGDLALVWATHARAPVTWAAHESAAALVLGDAIDGPSARRVTADELAAKSWSGGEEVPDPSDGYFAALHYSTGDGIRVWADVLGFFPLYHWVSGETVLVGSSPTLFQLHPGFRVELSREGLGGILLTNGLVANATPLAGVRRLAAGQVFVGPHRGRPAREQEHYRVPLSHDLADLAFDDLLVEFGDIVERTCRRLVSADGKASILLSGGLDSRVVVACGVRSGCELTAVTFGQPGEQELRIARQVGKALGLEHHTLGDTPTAPVDAAVSKARWEHLAGGFFRATRWGLPTALADLPQPVLAGYALDFLAGPKRMQAAGIARTGGDPFARAFDRQSRWGIGPANLDPLLGVEGLSQSLQDYLRAHYEGLSPHPAKAQWAHNLRHRARFHLGSVAWQIAMVSWPAFPALDRELLAFLGALPMSALSGRRLEADLLATRFPALAALPLDRNSPYTRPMRPRVRYLLAETVRNRIPWPRSDGPLYYQRLADLNGDAWRAVRREADHCRPLAERLLDPATLTRLLPPHDQRIEVKDVIRDSNGQRLLLGALLWIREFLS